LRRSRDRTATDLTSTSFAPTAVTVTYVRLNGVLITVSTRDNTEQLPGRADFLSNEVAFDLHDRSEVLVLTASTSDGDLRVQLPGNSTGLLVAVDTVDSRDKGETLLVSARIATENPDADAVIEYMANGDMRAAASMSTWIERAADLLRDKIEDPYGAAVGGYLLLRLRRYEQMHNWARNLADWAPNFADGPIIWASQQIGEQGSSAAGEIEIYLRRAVERGLPVYTEGMRLLSEGLRMLPSNAQSSLSAQLNERYGRGVWSSPITASVHGLRNVSANSVRVEYEISIAPRV
jgi:hypothetical protein